MNPVVVLLEYMAAGLPFVATATGEITKSVRDHGVGIYAEPRDHRQSSEALVQLIDLGPKDARRRENVHVRRPSNTSANRRQLDVWRTHTLCA